MRILEKRNEMVLLSIISVVSFTANLPSGALSHFVDQRMLLVTLATAVIIALFQYVQMLFSTVMFLSTIGANLPPEVASTVGLHPPVLTVTLVILVSIALLNSACKLIPTGVFYKNVPRIDTEESRLAVLAAISKGNQSVLLQLLESNVEINFFHNGTAPVLYAAEKGYSDVIRILIQHGADFRVKNEAGQTSIDIALSKKFIRSAEILHLAAKEHPEANCVAA